MSRGTAAPHLRGRGEGTSEAARTLRSGSTSTHQRAQPPGLRRPDEPGSRLRATAAWTLLAVLAVLLVVAVALVVMATTGRLAPEAVFDPGTAVRWALPAVRAVGDTAACLTIGLLLWPALALPDPSGDRWALTGLRLRTVRCGGAAAAVWAASEAASLVLAYPDASGERLGDPGSAAGVAYFALHIEAGRILLASLVIQLVVAHLALLGTRATTAGSAAALSLAALLPLSLSGHAAGAPDHINAVNSLAAHLLAVTTWLGTLAASAVTRRHVAPEQRGDLDRRYRRTSTWCVVVVALSGLDSAALRLGSLHALATSYGHLVLATSALFLLLAASAAGIWTQRPGRLAARRPADRPGTARPRLLLDGLLMATALGVSTVMGRSAPPVSATTLTGPTADYRTLLGFAPPPPLTVRAGLTQWYPDWLAIALVTAALGLYLAGTRRAARAGTPWPHRRTGAWVAGCLLLLWLTSGSPAIYGMTSLGGHMVMHMLLVMVISPLLVVGRPVQLLLAVVPPRADASTGPREWCRRIADSRPGAVLVHPGTAALVLVASLVAFYETPLLTASLATHTGHMVMVVAFLVIGCLFGHAVLPRPAPSTSPAPAALRLLAVAAAMTIQTLLDIALLTTRKVLASSWWPQLGQTHRGAVLRAQQHGLLAGWIVGEAATAVILLVIARQWERST